MAQESIFGRISMMARANINALLDKAEDPEKMLDQMVRDYTNSIAEAKEATAGTIGQLRLAEKDLAEARETAGEWGAKALAASQKADRLRASAQAGEADKYDNLAKSALQRQITAEDQTRSLEAAVGAQTQTVDKLKEGLTGMEQKLSELRSRRDELVARHKLAQAQMQDSVEQINVADPTSDLGRFEDKVRLEEARAMGNAELAASSLDAQFDSLDDDADALEIEARLAALKSGGANAAISASAEPVDAEIVE